MSANNNCRSLFVTLVSAALAALTLGACGGAPIPASSGDGGSIALPDGVAAADGASGAWRFVADQAAKPGAPTVRLALRDIQGTRARLDVVVDNVQRISALAFRLAYQPGRVVVADTASSKVWAGARVVERFKAQNNGQLWAGIGHVGFGSVPGGQGAVVATIAVDLYGDDPLPIRFVALYSRLLDPDGVVEASYAGGRFEKSK